MDELTIRLIITLLPGAIACIVYNKLSIHQKWSSFQFIVYSILNGVISYLILQILIFILIFIFSNAEAEISQYYSLKVWEVLDNSSLPYLEVLFASLLGVPLGLTLTFLNQNKILNKWANSKNISTKYGDDNLFNHYLNSEEIKEVYLRDIKNNLIYHGVLNYFSENNQVYELVLNDVHVYANEDSSLIYNTPSIYLSFKKDLVIIEQALMDESYEENSTETFN